MKIRKIRPEKHNQEENQTYLNAVLIAFSGNLILAVAKGLLAWITGSSAIFSDAANSISDTFYSLLMGLGLYLSKRPADQSHPQGHSRFEPFVSLFIASAMAFAGITAMWQSIQRFLEGATIIRPGFPTVVLMGAALLKVGMYRVVWRLGTRVKSPAIKASARDNLVDVLTTVTAIAGVWGSNLLHPYFDPALGIFIGFWIIHTAWKTTSENLGYLAGRGASQELIREINSLALEFPGVRNAHRIIADYVGPKVRVDMHIEVDGDIPLKEVHVIVELLKEKIENLSDVDLVFIHVEPYQVSKDTSKAE